MAGDTLWKVEDVAAFLRTTVNQVRNARRRGQIPPGVKVPGVGLRWREGDFRGWITQLAAEGAE